jgi:hypothetical protein
MMLKLVSPAMFQAMCEANSWGFYAVREVTFVLELLRTPFRKIYQKRSEGHLKSGNGH